MNRTLTLLRGSFGRAHPVKREGRPEWIPRSGFALIMDSRNDYWILCAEDAIPPEVPRISDLAVFHLQPDGFMIVEIMRAIEPHLPGIHMEATSIFKSDKGVLVVKERDVAAVTESLSRVGYAVVAELAAQLS